jgi:glycine cleavage system H lipoate-binding protein
LPADIHYWVERHVWALESNGLVTVGVTAPLGDALHWSPEVVPGLSASWSGAV